MRQKLSLTGGGGGGGGGGSSYKQTPDNLRSNDSFEMLLGLGEGRWKGLVNGHKSLFINDVPLESGDGTPNFQDFTAIFADGDPSDTQIVSFHLGAGGATSSVNLALTNTNTSGPGPWVTAAVTTPGVEFIDLRFVVQQLYHQDKTGTYNATANIEVQLLPSGGSTWVNPLGSTPSLTYDPAGYNATLQGGTLKVYLAQSMFSGGYGSSWNPSRDSQYLNITGKTTSPTVKELRIAVPNEGAWANKTWTVRCRLIEKDLYQADPVEDRRTILFESVAGVSSTKLGSNPEWRGLVWLQLFGKASDQINGRPTVRGIYDTKIVKVPPATVFIPGTRVYTGATWDGTDNFAYTNDPAWCLRDLVENPTSGISAFAPGTTLNKWDCLEASKYWSQMVPDGKGGTHPRFSLNIGVDDPRDSNELLQYIAGAFGGVIYEGGDGRYRLSVDRPQTPSAIFTKENIVGEFVYSHSDVDTRFNDYTATFLNEEANYVQDFVRDYNQSHIDQFGRRPTSITLVGCTNRQEALRRTRLRLRTSMNEFIMVNFQTNRQATFLEPLSTILIADADLGTGSPAETTGRILSMNGARTQLTLRETVRLEIGVNYTVKFTVPNPNYDPLRTTQPSSADWRKPTIVITRNVTNTSGQRGNVTTIYLDAALPSDIDANANFALEAVGLPTTPITYRVVDFKVDDNDPELINVTAIIVDTGKYDAADAVTETAINSQQPSLVVPPPTTAAVPFNLRTFQGDYTIRQALQVDWTRPNSLFLSGFTIEHNLNDGPWSVLVPEMQADFYELFDPTPGIHGFRIYANDRRGARSLPLVSYCTVPAIRVDASAVNGLGDLALVDSVDYATQVAGSAKPEDNATRNIDAQLYYPMNYLSSAGFLQDFDVTAGSGTPDLSIVGTGDTGGSAIDIGNNSGNDYHAIIGKKALPYSPEDLYEVMFDVETVNITTQELYLGLIPLNSAGSPIIPSDGGSFPYVAFAGSDAVGRKVYRGYFRGVADAGAGHGVGLTSPNPASPCPLPTGTVAIKLLALLGYNSGPSRHIVHSARLRKVEDLTPIARGTYSNTTTYYRGDMVLSAQGRSFVLTVQSSTGHTPPASASSDTYWTLVADKGQDGSAGAPGASAYTWIAYADAPDGSINFTTGSPGGRAYIGIAENKTTATESTVASDYNWTPYKGPASFGMVTTGGCVLASNRVISNGSVAAWGDGSFYSSEAFVGSAMVSFRAEQTSGAFMVGLNTDPTTDANWTSIDYAIHPYEGATYGIYESGSYTGYGGSYSVGTIFSIVYDGKNVRYLVDGAVVRSVAASPNLRLYMDSAWRTPNTGATILGWTVAGPAGTDGAPGSPGLNTATVRLYQRTASAPSNPTGTQTYTFSSGAVTGGSLGSWTTSIPATNGQPCWVIEKYVSSSSSTASITSWSTPVKLVEDGADGGAVSAPVKVFIGISNVISVRVLNGETKAPYAQLLGNQGGGGGTIQVSTEYNQNDGTGWHPLDDGTAGRDSGSGPLSAYASIPYTNSTGRDRVVDFRATGSSTNAGSFALNAGPSYLEVS